MLNFITLDENDLKNAEQISLWARNRLCRLIDKLAPYYLEEVIELIERYLDERFS